MSESSNDTPDWLKEHTETPSKIFIASDSDDEDDFPLVRRGTAARSGVAPETDEGPSQPVPSQHETVHSWKGAAPGASGPQQQRGPTAPSTTPKPVQLKAKSKPHESDTVPASREKQEQEALPQRSGQTSEQQTQQCAQAQLADMEPALAVHDTAVRSLPIMLPEKLNRNKVLVELPPCDEGGQHYHGSADLSGDSGAVGRIVILREAVNNARGASAGTPGRCDGGEVKLQVDLKGVMYNGWVLPLAATAMVLNIGPTEAKVESLFNDFVRLREAANPYGGDVDGGNAELAYLLDGDDENYLEGSATLLAASGAEGADGEGAPGRAGKGAKGSGKPRKRAAPDKAAVGGAEKKPKKVSKQTAKTNKKTGTGGKKKAGSAAAVKVIPGGAVKPAKKHVLVQKPVSETNKGIGGKAAVKCDAKGASEQGNKKAASQRLGVKGGGVSKRSGKEALSS